MIGHVLLQSILVFTAFFFAAWGSYRGLDWKWWGFLCLFNMQILTLAIMTEKLS